jgi:3-oxoacyl-[acyl-carrier protein] reductase
MSSAQARCVLVTGGSRGLGLAFVKDLLAQGYRVATCSRSITEAVEELTASHGPDRFRWCQGAIGDEAQEAALMEDVLAWCGDDGLYGLVNNAGIAKEGILATFPNVDSESIIEINLVGALRIARLALRHMLRRKGGGRVVNISSIIGSRGYTGLAAYSVSKAGMDGLSRALAREVGRRGITVNSIAPGYLETEMSSTLAQRQRQQIVGRTPMGRLGTVDDVVPVLRFLLSDGAGFMTGQTLLVDGGITT